MRCKFNFLLFFICTSYINSAQSDIKKTKVMVLATPHLSQINNLEPKYLSNVIKRINVEKFDAVAVEQMPAALLLEIKSRDHELWKELYNSYNSRIIFGQSLQEKFGISQSDAHEIIKSVGKHQELSNEELIEVINAHLCNYDSWSALLYFKQLTNPNLLDTEVLKRLTSLEKSTNEINQIGIQIATQNNLKKIYYIDDLQDETELQIDYPEFMNEYLDNNDSIHALIDQEFFKEIQNLESECIQSNDFYPLYSFYNSDTFSKRDYQAQWSIWFKTNFASKSDRSRYSLWEKRNLSITAHIMNVVAAHPEQKILVIIGSSHKGFIEKYLKQIDDIELIEF